MVKTLTQQMSPKDPKKKEIIELVVFHVEDESFGIDIFKVAEITKVLEIVKVPKSLPFIEGIVNLRGRVIPVLDLRRRLGFPISEEIHQKGRIIVVKLEGMRLGLLVDAVTRVANIPKETVERVPPSTLQIDSEFIKGVGHLADSLIIILNLNKLLTVQEKQMLSGKK